MARTRRSEGVSVRAQKRSQTQMRLLIAVIVGAVVIVGLIVFLTLPGAAPAPADVVPDKYAGLEQTITEGPLAIGFSLGDPDARVTVYDYSDFSCPHCERISADIERVINEYVQEGDDVRVVFKPITFVNPPYSMPAGSAGYCAAEQGKFWEMHEHLWDLYRIGGYQAYTQAAFESRAELIDGIDVEAFTKCFNSAQTQQALAKVGEEALALQVTGTPTILVNDKRVEWQPNVPQFESIRAAIEAELKN